MKHEALPEKQDMDSLASGGSRHVHIICPRCRADASRRRYMLTSTWIVTCEQCEFSYVDPRASSEDLERKIQLWAEQDVVDEARLGIAFDEATLALCRQFLERVVALGCKRSVHLLDLGSATGALLSVARDMGFEVQGIEMGRASARYARDQLGLDVQCGSLYDIELEEGACDAITMVEVIEHLEDPAGALARIRRWLSPHGVLLVTTPNFDSLYRRFFGARWWVINCEDEHIVFFNLDTLTGMLEEQGFEVIHHEIRNIDVLGILRATIEGVIGSAKDTASAKAAVHGYYEMRSAKLRVRNVISKLGLLWLVRLLLRALNYPFSWRYSPLFAWGEQLVVVARRKEVPRPGDMRF